MARSFHNVSPLCGLVIVATFICGCSGEASNPSAMSGAGSVVGGNGGLPAGGGSAGVGDLTPGGYGGSLAAGFGGSSSNAGTTDAGGTLNGGGSDGRAGASGDGMGGVANAGGSPEGRAGDGGSGPNSIAGGSSAGAAGSSGAGPYARSCANCTPLFDGSTLSGWIAKPAGSWSVLNGALHSLGPARGFLYTAKTYGSFRFIFSSRLISDPAGHYPCVLFWGNSPSKDALSALQIQPPAGYMWDYRTTGPTANKSPDQFEKRLSHPGISDKQWSQCEMLADQAAGTLRFACCQLVGSAACKATEIVDFKDPSAGLEGPLALQVHNKDMIEEFKDLYIESPVRDPSTLVTTQ